MTRDRITRNVFWLLFEKAFRSLGGFVVAIVVARYLGPSSYGLLNFALALVFFFSFLSDLGLRQIMVRELSKSPEKSPGLMGTSLVLKFLGGLLAMVLAIAFAAIIADQEQPIGLLVAVISLGFVFRALEVIDYYFQSRILSKYSAISRNLAFLFSGALKILFVFLALDVFWFAIAGTIDLALVAVFLVLAYRSVRSEQGRWKFESPVATSLLKNSWPLMLSVLLIAIHMRVDQVMIGNMLSSADVGVYSVAVRITEAWFLFPAILTSTLLPVFVELREKNILEFRLGLRRLYSAMFWSSLTVGVFILLFGERLILILVGEEYLQSYEALVINIWAGIFVAQGMARGIWLTSENLQKYRLYNSAFAVVLNILGNIVLIPRLGIAGAALSTLISQAISIWIFSLVWRPIRQSTLELIRSVNPIHLFRSTST